MSTTRRCPRSLADQAQDDGSHRITITPGRDEGLSGSGRRGKDPANNQILYNCQAIFNLMPNLNQDALVESMLVKTNDYHLAVYCASS